MEGNGIFGKWITDENGLPAYDYTCDQFADPNATTPTTYGYSLDHFHQIGNDRITATAHNGGYVQVLESSRGFQWLTYRDRKKFKLGGGITIIEIDNSNIYYSDFYTSEITQIDIEYQRLFGIGYFKKRIIGADIELKNTICAPFTDDAVFVIEIEVHNTSNTDRTLKLINFWDIYLRHITRSLVVTANNRKSFGKSKILNKAGKFLKFLQKIVKMDTDGSRDKFDKKFNFKAKIDSYLKTAILTPYYKRKSPPKDKPAKHNYYPKSIFLSLLNTNPSKFFLEQSSLFKHQSLNVDWDSGYSKSSEIINSCIDNPCLGIGTELILKANETSKISFLFGYANQDEMSIYIEKYRAIINHESILQWNAKKWKKSFVELNIRNEPWFSRETKWHSYYTRSTAYFDEYFNNHVFPQGSIYQFGHGLDGAIRDYVLYLYSIIFLDPNLAKEYLSYIISLMEPDGKLPYSRYGFAKFFTGSVHSKPSDLYLFLIWGVLQYVYTVRDFNFLSEEITFYPKSLNQSSTVLERLLIALKYLFSEKVGFGVHGLIKVNDGDWSDGISLMVKSRKKFLKYGESSFNSTFALYLFQKLIPLLDKYNPEMVIQCRDRYDNLKEAILRSFNGKWYYRGWDGQGTPIGDKNIYLEHHTWLLISKLLDKQNAETLIKEIYTKLDDPSPIGQYISYPAQEIKLNVLPKGWDVNGGIWHAMNALLTWGYSKYDIDKAFNSLKKNSMANRAEVYPKIWYGIWSGPDAYIADYAENAGEAFFHLTTPMCDFPIMNLNIHACYLLSVIKMAGIEADYDSITIAPKIKGIEFDFKSPILSITSHECLFSIVISGINTNNLILKIEKPEFWNDNAKISLDGNIVSEESEKIKINNEYIVFRLTESYETLTINLSKE